MVQGLVLRLLGRHKRTRQIGSGAPAAESGMGGEAEVPWVAVLTVVDMVQATIGAARLRDEGIPVHIRQEAASSAYPVGVGILGRIEVLVPEPQAAQAGRVLSDTLEAGIDDEAWRGSDADENGPGA